ncbi:MAG: 30S ribosomal protein S6 [Anaerolineales bacterium]|nr:30S ribosomal protein S6 [Anaerolineales bacterium]
MSNYELTYILRPLEEANLAAANVRIATQVKNAGGELVARNDWGRRRLAFPIKKNNDAYYTTLYVTLPGTGVRTVERQLKLSDDVLRFLFVRVDKLAPPQSPAPPPAAPATETIAAVEAAPVAPATVMTTDAPAAETPTEQLATTTEGS